MNLADGQWHRLHPATPLLRGGIAFVAVIGVLLANFRERLADFVTGAPGYQGDPVDYIIDHGLLPLGLLVVIAVLTLFVGFFYLSWRMHTFRITDELVEVRSGVIVRTDRKARLDRIQGISLARSWFARVFGAAKLEISVAGQDANVSLAYLNGTTADELRLEILRLASGTRQAAARATAPTGGLVEKRLAEFTAPELDPQLASSPASVVTMNPARLIGSASHFSKAGTPTMGGSLILLALIGSTLLSSGFIFFVLGITALLTAASLGHTGLVAIAIIPMIFGLGSFIGNRVVKSLRYSIAATPDGVRVGFGLISTSNETIPPGRVHAIAVSQPLLWRPADWWTVRINVASHSNAKGAAGQHNTTILPVGTRADALKVLELVLPGIVSDDTRELAAAGLSDGGGFTTSPRRAAVVRWLSWKRNGFALRPDAVVLRRGIIWRELVVVPTPRMQSVELEQGPLLRLLRLATVRMHTVSGPVIAKLGGVDQDAAAGFLRDVESTALVAMQTDGSHRWRAGEAPA